MKTYLLPLSLMLVASVAQAQTPAPAAAPAQAPATKPGPVIPGVCIYSNEAVMHNADVSKAAMTRLEQLSTAAEAELAPDLKTLETERESIVKQQQGGATQQTLQPLVQALSTKAQAFSDKAFIVNQELSRTEQQANAQLGQVIGPVLNTTYEARNCGMLVDRAAVLFANPAMDITGEVIDKLNASKVTVDIKRVVINEADRQKLLQLKAQQEAQQGGQ